MGRLGDLADILTAGLVLGGGYLAYRTWKGLPALPAFTWPAWPTWASGETALMEPSDVTLTAGVDLPLITFESVVDPSAWVPRAQLEAEVSTRRILADLVESHERAVVAASGLSREQITESERQVFEAVRAGVTDY